MRQLRGYPVAFVLRAAGTALVGWGRLREIAAPGAVALALVSR